MGKTVFIHLGTAKTGTTAIQRFLSSNDQLLTEKGFHYIRTLRCEDGPANLGSHNALAWILYHKHFNKYLNTFSIPFVARQDEFLATLSDEISSHSEHSIIISSEIFPMLNDKAIDELLALFAGRTVKVILYIRNLHSLSVSLASQVIKNQDSRASDERMSNVYTNHLHYFYSCYLESLSILAKKIGNENMIFRKYGVEYFAYGNIYADIMDAIGLTLTGDYIIPDKLQNESLKYCETIYFKDLLNRITLNTPQHILVDMLLAWERSHDGTEFVLPKYTALQIAEDIQIVNKELLSKYLDETYIDLINKPMPDINEVEYKLPYCDFINILDYLDSGIANFKDDFMKALTESLDRTYDYELKRREFEDTFVRLIHGKKAVALWGCGDIADKLFKKHKFLRDGLFYVIDKNPGKQGSFFWGHEILPISTIADKYIDTVIIISTTYADEICKEITDQYPGVRYIIKLTDLQIEPGIECIDLKSGTICSS